MRGRSAVTGAMSRRRLLLACALAAAVSPLAAPTARAEDADLAQADWQAIRKVISQQLAALRSGNAERAFGYASEGIRAQFGDAQSFMAMVRSGYSPLLTARYTEFLEGAVIAGAVIQPLRLIGPDNTVRVALYTLEKHLRGGWRITGCSLAPSTVRAA
jgi:hypothetical protein